MTNAEKYLKEDIVVRNLTNDLVKYCCKIGLADGFTSRKLEAFFEEQSKPTLTEDERVILRNIDKDNYKGIGRKNGTLYLVSATPNYFGGENDKEVFWYCFHELFKFIKERRRI